MDDYTVKGQGSMKRLCWYLFSNLWGIWVFLRIFILPVLESEWPQGFLPPTALMVVAVVLLVLDLYSTVQAWRNRSYIDTYSLIGMMMLYGCAIPFKAIWLMPWLWVSFALFTLRFLFFLRDYHRGVLPQQTGKPRDHWDQYELDVSGGHFISPGKEMFYRVVLFVLNAAIMLTWTFAPHILF